MLESHKILTAIEILQILKKGIMTLGRLVIGEFFQKWPVIRRPAFWNS